jgi:hypothetical protein
MKQVKFNKSCSPYTTGEIAVFDDEKADKLIEMGAATLVVKDEEVISKKRKRRSLGVNRQIDAE